MALCVLMAVVPGQSRADPGVLRVVVTTKPIGSLVAAVMQGIGAPQILVEGVSSPHSYSLRPSQARALHGADVFFRVSEAGEPFTGRIVQSLPASVRVVSLADTDRLVLRRLRRGVEFDDHHRHGVEAENAHDHGNGAVDPHIWLDPVNAQRMVGRISRVLGELRPGYSRLFEKNARAASRRIELLSAELSEQLASIGGRSFVVFHDAYQYFERRFGLSAVGAITIRPEVAPSAQRIAKLRKKIKALGAVCIFAEPQFGRRMLNAMKEGMPVRLGIVDPLGANIAAGPDHYFLMMRRLADGFSQCLGGQE